MKNLFYFLSILLFIGTTSCSNDDDSTSEPAKSSAKAITSFKFNTVDNDELDDNITAVINENEKTITAQVPYGTDITSLAPTIEVSPKATISPEGTLDFSSEMTYTVTAEDGTKADYTVTVTVTSNNEAQLLSFVFLAEDNPALENDVTATIDEATKTITAQVPYGTDITGLTPTLEVSTDASITPAGAQDFSSEVIYKITAQDGTTTDYKVSIQIGMEPQRAALIAIYNANPENTLGWDLENLDINSWQGVTVDENNNVIKLGLPNSNLSTIPAEVGQLTNLIDLDVYDNLITSVPSEIVQLSNLIELDLGLNKFITIPAEIGQLSKLELLYLDSNLLTSVPAEIGQLSNLNSLYLEENQLTFIPQEICDMETNYETEIYLDEGVTCE